MKHLIVHIGAWAAALATVLLQRLLWPLAQVLATELVALYRELTELFIQQPQPAAIPAMDYSAMTRRQLQELTGCRRNISKAQLLEMLQA